MLQVVTFDGPAGSGKSTVAKQVAAKLGWRLLDTGAMYRAVTLHLLQTGFNPAMMDEVEEGLGDLALTVDQEGRVQLDGNLIPPLKLRTPQIEIGVSAVSANSMVRTRLRAIQRATGAAGSLVAEGRDMGSVVFPEAAYKFFLDASVLCRARRRLGDFIGQGRSVHLDQIIGEIERRDRADRERTDGPLVCPKDAINIDTSELDLPQVIDRVFAILDPAMEGDK